MRCGGRSASAALALLLGLSTPPVAGPVVAKPAAAASAHPAAGHDGTVGVRFGSHDGYDRLVLEWGHAIHPKIATTKGEATISFDRPAEIDVRRLNAVLPDAMRPAHLQAGRMALSFRIPPGKELQNHSEGNLVIVDIASVSAAAPEAAPVAAAAPPEPKRPAAAAQEKPAPTPPRPAATAPATPPAPEPSFADEDEDVGRPLTPLPDAVVVADTADGRLVVRRSPLPDGLSYRFEWTGKVAAAAFRLGNSAWVVFNVPVALSIKQGVAGRDPALTQLDNSAATVLRLAAPSVGRIIVGRAGDAWLVDVRRAAPDGRASSFGRVAANESGTFQVKNATTPVTFADPATGEILFAVPLRGSGVHVDRNASFPTYQQLPTGQGLLFRPESDLFRVVISDDRVRATADSANTTAMP